MKIKEIQKKGDNLYTVTFERNGLFGQSTFIKDVTSCENVYIYADGSNCLPGWIDTAIKGLIVNLKGNELLKIN